MVERLRDARLVELATGRDRRGGHGQATAGSTTGQAGGQAAPADTVPRRASCCTEHGGHWTLATGEHPENGSIARWRRVVRDVRPGVGIRVQRQGLGDARCRGTGRPDPGPPLAGSDRHDQRQHGRLRATSLDVGLSGTILVIGSRVDAEALTRARAMGVRGVDRERPGRQGAARLPRLRGPPAGRAPSPAAVRGARPRRRRSGVRSPDRSPPCSRRCPEPTVAISIDPPALVFDEPGLDDPARRRPTTSASGPATMPARRVGGRAWPGRAGSRVARSSRPAGSSSAIRRRSPVPHRATSSGSPDDGTAGSPAGRLTCPPPPILRVRVPADLGRGHHRASASASAAWPRPATSSACGATSAPARPSSRRGSRRGLGVDATRSPRRPSS